MSTIVRGLRTGCLVLAITLVPSLSSSPSSFVGRAWAEESESAHAATEGAEHEGGSHEGGEHAEETPSIDGKKLGLQLFNFAVLLVILVKFGGGALSKALLLRHNQLKADLAQASELRAAAEAKLAKQEQRLARLETEIGELRQGVKAEAEAEKQKLIAAAEERAKRIQDETVFLVNQQVREAEAKLRRESADAALKMAEDILRRAVGPADQQSFLNKFVAGVETSAASNGKAS